MAYAVAYLGTLCFLADQRSEQETISRFQHRVVYGPQRKPRDMNVANGPRISNGRTKAGK